MKLEPISRGYDKQKTEFTADAVFHSHLRKNNLIPSNVVTTAKEKSEPRHSGAEVLRLALAGEVQTGRTRYRALQKTC